MKWIHNVLRIAILSCILACGNSQSDAGNSDERHSKAPKTKIENNQKGNVEHQKVDVESETFQRILKANQTKLANAEQLILATNSVRTSSDVVIRTLEKNQGQWIEKHPKMQGSIGRNGFAAQDQKREGDKASPTGIYQLGPAFGYDDEVATKMDYKQATQNDFWIDDPASDDYNKWVTLPYPPKASHEKMKRQDHLYKLGIVVQYNTHAPIKGNGSAIFVHVHRKPGSPTAGCIALDEDQLSTIITWLNPDKNPLIVMGTEKDLSAVEF